MSDRLLHPLLRLAIGVALVLAPVLLLEIGAGVLHAAPAVQIAVRLAASLLAVFVYVAFVRRFERRPVVELDPRGAVGEVALGIALGLVLIGAVIGSLVVLGVARIEPGGAFLSVWPVLSLSIGAALFEETLFRGLLFRLVEAWRGTVVALVVSSAFFGAAHMANPVWTWLGVVSIMLEAGLLLGAAYLVTRRLWLPMGLHAAWNFAEGGVFGLPVSGFPTVGWWRTQVEGPDWLSGGVFGPESSVVTVVFAFAIAGVLLDRARRRGAFVARGTTALA